MKKLISAILACGLLIGATACQNTPPDETEDQGESESDVITPVLPDENINVPASLEIDKTYTNPVMSKDNYDMGDPFAIRYNGKYYLYHTSINIECYVSDDLVNWTHVGSSAPNQFKQAPYAPEVTYYNGKFYMYTSPGGNGHYVLVSDSPTGPFVTATENLYLSIDGNVFIDDDGKWYFTSAGVTPNATGTTVSKMGLGMYEMKSPTEIDKSSVMDTGLIMDNTWTEGPMLIKYGHRYFMTYCGNHYLSPGYRINYAYGDSPISLTEATNSPILINTNPSVDVAIGHNSLVVGPNLDSMYIVYHSMVNPSLGRNDDIDPIYINGKHMQALGPTTTVQQAPEMPDVYSHFDAEDSLAGWKAENAAIVDGNLTVSEGGRVLSEKTFDGNYTAEFNFLTINGKAGAIFEYTDENNFASAIVDTAAKELVITFKANGEGTVYNVPVKGSFDEDLNFGVLQCLTVKKSEGAYTFLLNNLTVHECENTLASGAVGVTSVSGDAKFGFVGAEGNVWMSSYKELAKPIEGEIQAITCIEENVTLVDHNDINYLTVNGGEAYNYYVNVTDKANFDLGIHYTASVDTKFDLYFNGKLLTSGTLKASDNRDNTEIIRGLALPAGSGVFTIRVNEGKADIFSYEFTVHEDITGATLDISAPFYSEGEWEVDDGEFESFGDGKYLYGNENWGDYTYSITLEGAYSNHISNVLFRASEAALGGANDNIKEGKNFFIGYFVNIKTSGKNATLSLNKQIYAPTELYSVEAELTHDGGPCTVKITTKGSNIKVYLDDTLVIDYTDPKPIMNGAVGFQFTEKIAYAYASDIKISE